MTSNDESNSGANGHDAPAAHALTLADPAGAPAQSRPYGFPQGAGFNLVHDVTFSDPRQVITRALAIIRSRWLFGFFSAVVVGACIGALLFRFRPIEFTAETTLLAQSPLDQILNPTGPSAAGFDLKENALTNHLSVMLSRSFFQRVADSFTPEQQLDIQRPYLQKGQQPSPAFLLGVLSKKIDVQREREREFFTITVKHASAETALLIANRFADSYLNLVQNQIHKANRSATESLKKQADGLAKEILALEEQRREYRKQHNLISADENRVILDDRLKQVNLARADLRVQRSKLEAEVNQARDDLARSPLPFSNTVLTAYGGTQILRQQLDSLEVQRDVLAIRYGPKHAKMIEVMGNIKATRDAIARNFQLAFNDIKSQLAVAVAAENGLNQEFEAAFKESLELSRNAARLDELAQEVGGKRRTLDELYQRIGKSSIDSDLPADVMRVIDPGYIHRPLVPMIAVYAALIGFFCLGTFAAAPLAANFFDEKVNEHVDIEAKLRVDVIGVIPRLSRTRSESRPHIVRDNVDLAYAESFLALAGQIDLVSRKGPSKRILVASTLPGEGKSTLASNLATAYTRLGRRTVLVDCDFRKPSQRTFHKIGGSSGLLHWARAGFQVSPGLLSVGGPVDATVLTDGTFLIPAGSSDLQPARYLIADGMARFFALLQREFEIVVVDTPPAGIFQDALMVARHCDETVFVARDGMARTRQLTPIVKDFSRTAAPVIGVVLNAFSPNGSHPRLGYSQMYHKYGYPMPRSRSVARATS